MFNEYTCKIHSFLGIFFTHASSMILLYMSVDRAIAISVVLRRSNQITGTNKSSVDKSCSNTNKIVLALFVLISLLNVHFLLFTHLIPFDHAPEPPTISTGQPPTIVVVSSLSPSILNSSSSSLADSLYMPQFDLPEADSMPLRHSSFNNITSLRFSASSAQEAAHFDRAAFYSMPSDDNSSGGGGIFSSSSSSSGFEEYPTIRICHAVHDTLYYYYLIVYFPW